MGTKIIYEIYPIMVENFEDNFLYLNQGGDQIKTGDLYTLYEKTQGGMVLNFMCLFLTQNQILKAFRSHYQLLRQCLPYEQIPSQFQ